MGIFPKRSVGMRTFYFLLFGLRIWCPLYANPLHNMFLVRHTDPSVQAKGLAPSGRLSNIQTGSLLLEPSVHGRLLTALCFTNDMSTLTASVWEYHLDTAARRSQNICQDWITAPN